MLSTETKFLFDFNSFDLINFLPKLKNYVFLYNTTYFVDIYIFNSEGHLNKIASINPFTIIHDNDKDTIFTTLFYKISFTLSFVEFVEYFDKDTNTLLYKPFYVSLSPDIFL